MPIDQEQPATVSAKGIAPANRITTALGARKIYEQAREQERINDARFASLSGIGDGNPPFNPAEQAEQGMAEMPNLNLRQFGSKIDTYVSTLIDHNCSGDQWFEVQLDPEKFDKSGLMANRASQYTTGCLNDAIKRWEDDETENSSQFLFERTICDTQMGIFGIGALSFADEIDWRPCAVPRRKVMLSPGSKITLANCSAAYVERNYTVAQLFSYIENEETAKGNGWNRKEVIRILHNKTAERGGSGTDGFESMSEWQNRIRNNDTCLRQDFNPVELIHVYVQEFNTTRQKDGVSHYVVSKLGGAGEDFLYERDRQFKRFSQALVLFASQTGPEGDFNGVKGFGDLIFDQCHLANMLFCHIATMAIIQSSPQFQAGDASDRDKLSQIVFSRLGIMFPDVKVSEMRIQADLTGAMAVMSENNRVMNTNTRIFPQNDADAGGEQPTATQVTFDRQDQASFTSLQIKWYRLTGADPLAAEMYRRLSLPESEYPTSWPGGKTAAWFRKKMKDYGIKPEQYRHPKSVKANRTGGSGNSAIDSMKAKEVLSVATPGKGQLNARYELSAALYGHERAAEFVEATPQPEPEDVVIGLENTTLQNGQFVAAFGFQDHFRHLGEASQNGNGHLAILATALLVAEQMDEAGLENSLPDAIKLLNVLKSVQEHSTMHVGFLGSLIVNEKMAGIMAKTLSDAGGFIQNFEKAIESAAQKAQPQGQQQPSAENMAIIAKTQADIEALKLRTTADIEIAATKSAAKIDTMAQTSESRQRIREAETAQRLGIEAQQAIIEQERERARIGGEFAASAAKTVQEMNITRAKSAQELLNEKAKAKARAKPKPKSK